MAAEDAAVQQEEQAKAAERTAKEESSRRSELVGTLAEILRLAGLTMH